MENMNPRNGNYDYNTVGDYKTKEVSAVASNDGLESRFSMRDKIIEEAALELDGILSNHIDLSQIKKPATYSKVIRRWLVRTLEKAF